VKSGQRIEQGVSNLLDVEQSRTQGKIGDGLRISKKERKEKVRQSRINRKRFEGHPTFSDNFAKGFTVVWKLGDRLAEM